MKLTRKCLIISKLTLTMMLLLSGCTLNEHALTGRAAATRRAARARGQLVLAYLSIGEWVQAGSQLALALSHAPTYNDIRLLAGFYHQLTGNQRQAEVYYQAVLKQQRQHLPTLVIYVYLLCQQRRYQQAGNYYSELLTMAIETRVSYLDWLNKQCGTIVDSWQETGVNPKDRPFKGNSHITDSSSSDWLNTFILIMDDPDKLIHEQF